MTGMFEYENESEVANTTLCELGAQDAGVMSWSEIVTVIITGSLGMTGIVLNIGVLAVVYKHRLIKKDYRMMYYSFVTLSDFLFATHALFLAFNIAFKEVYVFRVTGVCYTFIMVFGIIAYEWSAMCIIFLLVDLVWTIRSPFNSDDSRQIVMSRVSCVMTLIIGITIPVIPMLKWNDMPFDLPFCSIANLYGAHWDFYQHQAVIVLSILIATLVVVSVVLLRNIYSSHIVSEERSSVQQTRGGKHLTDHVRDNIRKKQNEEVNGKPTDVDKCQSGRCMSNTDKVTPMPCPDLVQKLSGSPVFMRKDGGEANLAYVVDVNEINATGVRTEAKTVKNKKDIREKYSDNHLAQASKREVHRREFIRACGTVGMFMMAYLGCCMPYYVTMLLGLGCGSNCNNDNLEARVVRALVATALYLLPVVDPILYTKRFKVFNQSAVSVLRLCCVRKRASVNVDQRSSSNTY